MLICIIFPLAIRREIRYNAACRVPGVAQLVGRLVWDQDAGSSSLPTRTNVKKLAFSDDFQESASFFMRRSRP